MLCKTSPTVAVDLAVSPDSVIVIAAVAVVAVVVAEKIVFVSWFMLVP